MVWMILGVLALVLSYVAIQGVRAAHGLAQARRRLSTYDVQTAKLSYGDITYLDEGTGR